MLKSRVFLFFILLSCLFLAFFFYSAFIMKHVKAQVLVAKIISLDPLGEDHLRVLGGPPETVSMRSSVVVLAPGESVKKHDIANNEEIVIVLEGEGTMIFKGKKALPLKAGWAVYRPPNTEHRVVNTGKETLKYIYVVADAK